MMKVGVFIDHDEIDTLEEMGYLLRKHAEEFDVKVRGGWEFSDGFFFYLEGDPTKLLNMIDYLVVLGGYYIELRSAK